MIDVPRDDYDMIWRDDAVLRPHSADAPFGNDDSLAALRAYSMTTEKY